MKILMLSKYFYPHIGGVEKHVLEMSRELIKKGHQVTVLTLQHEQKLPLGEEHNGIKIVRIPFSEKKLQIWKQVWQYRKLIEQADIIHCHDIFFWYLPFRFLYLTKPVYTTFHGWEGEFPIPRKNKLVRKISEQLSWGNICVGDYISRWYGTKPDFITYGAVESVSSKKIKEKDLNECVFIGRLGKDMGMNEFLKALATIKKKYGFKITFVGDGSYKNKAKKIGLVTGFIKNITSYLKKPAFIFTSSYLVILEAMAYQRPVFVLYHNPLKKDCLVLHPGAKYMKIAGSAEELIEQFENAVANPQKINQTIDKGYCFSRQQTWRKLTKQYLKLWKI